MSNWMSYTCHFDYSKSQWAGANAEWPPAHGRGLGHHPPQTPRKSVKNRPENGRGAGSPRGARGQGPRPR